MYINFFLSPLLYVLIIEPKFHSFSCQIPFHPRRTQQTNAWKPRDEKFHAIPNSLAFMSKNFIGNTYVYTMFIYHLKNSTTCPEPNFVTFLFNINKISNIVCILLYFPLCTQQEGILDTWTHTFTIAPALTLTQFQRFIELNEYFGKSRVETYVCG